MSLAAAPGTNRTRLLLLYLAGLATALGLFLAISWGGERALGSGVASAGASPPAPTFDIMLHVLLALAVVMVAGRLVGGLFGYLHQPPVIGEVFAGIMLGPSLLGSVFPSTYAFLLPGEVAPFLGVIAQLGVVLYMFVVGLHLDLRVLHTSAHATLAISHASIVVPFLLGAVLALALYRGMAGEGIGFTAFALFLGVSMSVTAFPVLARILEDKGLQRTELGMLALTCAAARRSGPGDVPAGVFRPHGHAHADRAPGELGGLGRVRGHRRRGHTRQVRGRIRRRAVCRARSI
jgi:hypothetical protein